MGQTFEGHLNGSGLKVGIVLARWNDFMGAKLLEGAKDALLRHGVAETDIDVALVPGSFEVPQAARKMAGAGAYHAVVCLGVLIRGATLHFELIAGEATRGIAAVAKESGIPVTFGIITTDTIEQAIERCGSKAGNKGAEAAMACLEMVNLYAKMAEGKRG